jgi:hypothetical protein
MKNFKKASLVSILVALILVLSAANMVHAVEVTATIPVNTDGILAYDSGKGEIFTPDVNSNHSVSSSVSVISDVTNTVVATVTVPYVGGGIAYDSGKGEIFVSTEDSVSVISDSNNTVVATVAFPA